MSCGAFGGSGNCGSGGAATGGSGGALGGAPGGCAMPRRCADRGFFDPFCMPMEKPRFEPSCYFNPFVHAQCLGVDMNMQGFRNDILKCQEDYKKAVWAVLKKYAVGDGSKDKGKDNNASNAYPGSSNNNMNRDFGRINNSNNFRRSNSSGFPLDDPRFQRSRRNLPSGRPM